MSSREIGEWMAFFTLEAEEWEEKQLRMEAEAGVEAMRSKRGKR